MIGYHINLFYSEEDKGYIVDIPDLRLGRPFDIFSGNEIILSEKGDSKGELGQVNQRRGLWKRE